jgi:hypothetical protein
VVKRKKYCKIHPSYRKLCETCGCIIMKPSRLCKECKYKSNEANRKKVYKWKTKEMILVREYRDLLKKGGCVLCGYDTCTSALHFHHIGDAKTKGISKCTTVSQIKREILNSSLVILCANCHFEAHSGLIKEHDLIKDIITC